MANYALKALLCALIVSKTWAISCKSDADGIQEDACGIGIEMCYIQTIQHKNAGEMTSFGCAELGATAACEEVARDETVLSGYICRTKGAKSNTQEKCECEMKSGDKENKANCQGPLSLAGLIIMGTFLAYLLY